MPNSRVAVLTGSTGGIGSAIANLLASLGWNLVLANRAGSKAIEQRAALTARFPDIQIDPIEIDLMDLGSIERCCETLAGKYERVDALLNIAGILTDQRRDSKQSYEAHYAVNVLSNYALIQGLRPLLRRNSDETPSMVVTMSSSAIRRVAALELDELKDPSEIGGLMGAYAHSKLAVTAMSVALSEELQAEGIFIRAIDPGATLTPMTSGKDGMPFVLRLLAPLLFSKPDDQALVILVAAKPGELSRRTGIYVSKGKERALPKTIDNPVLQRKLLEQLQADIQNSA